MTLPWGPAVATGIGSLPGVQAREAAAIIAGELPAFLHLAELPARGPGADMVGRTGALLAVIGADFGLETTPDGWRITSGESRVMRRATSWLGEDLDALEEKGQGFTGPVKVQVVGPWTMAASVELPSGERMLRDPGACRDLAEGLAEAVVAHVGDVRRRLPGATVVVQVDEPGIVAVLEGSIGTASGLSRYAAVEPPVAESGLRAVLDAVARVEAVGGVHCCAKRPPIPLLRSAGARFIAVDLRSGDVDDEQLGAAWEGGIGVLAGVVPSTGAGRISDTEASRPIREAASRLGLTDAAHLAGIAITPTCGLAGATPTWARTAYAACTAVGRVLRHDQDEDADE